MSDRENLYTEFSKWTKKDWLDKIAAELKGKSFESLQSEWNDIKVDPFYQKEDLDELDQHISTDQKDNDWKIGEDITFEAAEPTNKILLETLANGVDAPCLILENLPEEKEFASILKSVRLDFIETYFQVKSPQLLAGFGSLFLNFLASEKIDARQIKGGIFSQDSAFDPNWLVGMTEKLPQFQFLSIKIEASDNLTQDLAKGIWEASKRMSQLIELGLSVDKVNQILQFSVDIGKNYFVEMAKLRALKLLWANILKAFDAADIYDIYIEARLSEKSQLEDAHRNMISATTQSMSAILAGVNCLNVLPADHFSSQQNPFTKRIARNVQHLLKMESYLDKVVDPAAGSYYVEELTQQIFHKTWTQFLLLEKQT